MVASVPGVVMRALRLSRPLKYRNQSWEYGGRKYHSKLEAAHAARLDQLKSAADPKERVVAWQAQISVPLEVNGVHICNYVVDFLCEYADGRRTYVEVKGFETPEWKLKEKLFRALYPERDLKVVR